MLLKMRGLLVACVLIVLASSAYGQSVQTAQCQSYPCVGTLLWTPPIADVNGVAADGYRISLNGVKVGADIVPGTASSAQITLPSIGPYTVGIKAFSTALGKESSEVLISVDAKLVVVTPTPTGPNNVNPPTQFVIVVGVVGTTTTKLVDSAGFTWELGNVTDVMCKGPTDTVAKRVGGSAGRLILVADKIYALSLTDSHWYRNAGACSSVWTDVGTMTPKN